MNKKVLVFGGSGFLGSHVSDKLSDSGYNVTIFDRFESSYLKKNQKMVVGDILDKKKVLEVVKKNNYVINFAGLSDIDKAKNEPIETVEQNILGNTIILESCRKAKIKRYIFASSIYVYSDLGDFYRISKQACENYIEIYNKVFGLNFTILRYGSLYGLRSGISNGVYRFIKSALKKNKMIFYGKPESLREFIHVEDAASCTLEIFKKEYINEHIIVTGQQSIKIEDLLKMISEILRKKIKIEYKKTAKQLHYVTTPYSFNPKKAKKINPTTYLDLGQGLLGLIENIYQKKL